jgi:hypothetical protein
VSEADGTGEVHTCERCGKVRPAGWTCACGGEGRGGQAPAPPGWDPATTSSSRPRLRLMQRPAPTAGGSGGLKSEAPTQVAGGHPQPSGSPPANRGSGGLDSEAPTQVAGGHPQPSGSPPVDQGSD